jgi:hypothetical protein
MSTGTLNRILTQAAEGISDDISSDDEDDFRVKHPEENLLDKDAEGNIQMKEVKNSGGRKEPKLELIMADDEFIAELS